MSDLTIDTIYSALGDYGYSTDQITSALDQIREEAWDEGMQDFESAYDQDNHSPWSFLPDNPYS